MAPAETKTYLYGNDAESLAGSLESWSQERHGVVEQLKFSERLMSHLSVGQRAKEMDDSLQAIVNDFTSDRTDF